MVPPNQCFVEPDRRTIPHSPASTCNHASTAGGSIMFCLTRPQCLILSILILATVCQAAQAQVPKAPPMSMQSLDDFLRSLAPSGELGAPAPEKEGLGTPKPKNVVICGRVPHECAPGEICVPCGNDGYCRSPGTSCCNGFLCYPPNSCVLTSWGARCQ